MEPKSTNAPTTPIDGRTCGVCVLGARAFSIVAATLVADCAAFVERLGWVLPYTIAVHRTRSVGLGIVVHGAANLLGLVVIARLARGG